LSLFFKKKNEPKIVRFGTLESTQLTAKELIKRADGKRESFVVLARRQTGGMGTKGRSFCSEKGGVYLTAVLYRSALAAKDAFLVMAGAAVAVCKTLEDLGLAPKIKWPNDVYVEDKKICGILIENVFSGGSVLRSEIGIGLNVYNHLPDELLEIATTIQGETGKKFSVKKVAEKLVAYLCEPFEFCEYQKRVGYLGEKQILLQGESQEEVTPLEISSDGGLRVLTANGEKTVFAAEVSLRIGLK